MKEVYIHPTAEVSPDAEIGSGTKIWNQAQIREGAEIGEGCIISKNVYIDAGVKIGNHVKIQNNVNVYHGVTIEDDVFLGPSMTFTNDRFPRAFNDDFEVGKTLIKRGASIGANATIRCDIIIGEYAMVGSGSVVTHDVPAYALVVGNPARQVGWVQKSGKRVKSSTCKPHGLRQIQKEHGQTLETVRLSLVLLRPADAENMFSCISQQEFDNFLWRDAYKSLEETYKYLKDAEDRGEFIWGIFEKNSGRLVGICSLVDICLADSRSDITCLIHPSFQRRGIASEAINAVFRYSFQELGIIRIQTFCASRDTASERLILKCGMQLEGTLRKYAKVQDSLQDYRVYAIINANQ